MIDLCRNSYGNPRLADGTVMVGRLWPLSIPSDPGSFMFSPPYLNCAGYYYLILGNIVAACIPMGRSLTWTKRANAALPHEAMSRGLRLMLWDRHGFPHYSCHARPEHRIVQVGGSLLSIPSPRHSTLQRLKITADPARADRAPSARVYTSKKKISSSP